jgi:hypothetical protein
MITSTKKLSKAQLVVLEKMFDGYQLKFTQGIDSNWWLLKETNNPGGYIKVNGNTAFALLQRGLIVIDKQSFPTNDYKLTATAIALIKRRRVRMQLDEISSALEMGVEKALALPGSNAGEGENGK